MCRPYNDNDDNDNDDDDICMPKHNAEKRFIVFIMDWSRNYTYKLSKCFVEQVRFKSGLERVMLMGRGFQSVGAALEKACFPNVSSRHLVELRRY